MKRSRKKYERPLKPWDKKRIEKEKEIRKAYGLKTEKEILNAEGLLRKFRRTARNLAAKKDKKQERMIIEKLTRLNLLSETAGLDDVLSLTLEGILERRLQTVIFRRGLANTPKHARQLITHGKVTIGDRKIIYPSYMVTKDDEDKIKVVR